MGEAAPSGGEKSWLRTALGTVGGLFSGACVMYLTAAVDKVVKPGKPVPNFKVEADGLNARFQNLTPKGSQGWWDFGDGSPLEPVTDQEFLAHAFPNPGEYTIKMTLQNLLGEEGERTVSLKVGSSAAVAPGARAATGVASPRIARLEIRPLTARPYAPATFQLVGEVSNAQLCVLDTGSDHLEVLADPADAKNRLVSFPRPGNYRVRLLAVNGEQSDERTAAVTVEAAPAGTLGLMLTVNDQATRVQSRNKVAVVSVFDRQVFADPGFEIADVHVPRADGRDEQLGKRTDLPLDAAACKHPGFKDLCLHLAKDRRAVVLTGSTTPDDAAKKGKSAPPRLALPVTLVQQVRSGVSRGGLAGTVTGMMELPSAARPTSTTTLPMPSVPPEWVDVRRSAILGVLDGAGAVKTWPLPITRPVAVTAQGRTWLLTATASGNGVNVMLRPATGAGPAAN